MTQTVNPADYGTDLSCREDADAGDRTTSGFERLAEELYHSITCPAGMIVDDEDAGIDVRALLLKPMTATQIEVRRNEIKEELLLDDRVASATVDLTVQNRERTAWLLKIRIVGKTVGPFSFVVDVTAARSLLTDVSAEGSILFSEGD